MRSALAEMPVLPLGVQEPRVMWLPRGGVEHPQADAVVEFADALGVELDPWQEFVLRRSLLRTRDDRRWAALAVGLCVARQNGKNGVLEVRELAGPHLLGEELVMHTAHLSDTAGEAFRRLEQLIEANEWLSKDVKHIWRANGKEAIEFRGDKRIKFKTRTKGGGRGWSGDLVVFDEAMELPEASLAAAMPVISARPDPQMWYTGSAVDQVVHEHGVVFARVRDRALMGEDPRLAYFEWSVDAEGPDAVTDHLAGSVHAWAQANPALGIRIDPEYVTAERRELAARSFAVERLGVGDWPAVDASANFVIDPDGWDDLADRKSKFSGSVSFAFDVTPDRSRTSISASGLRPDGRPLVEMVERRAGTGWVADKMAALVAKHRPLGTFCDASGPAASLLPDLERAGVQVTTVTAGEHARACGMLFDYVDQKKLRHLGQPELAAAIRGAKKRNLGDAWGWDRKSTAVDISPLVSCTLALWGSSQHRPVYKTGGFR